MKYVSYVLVVCALGIGLFFYEIHINSEPLLQVTSEEVASSTPVTQHPSIEPLSLIVVRTDADKERGLGGRTSLPVNEGMIFSFDTPSSYGIWMKDMQFSIDIISLDANFSVVHVESAVSPQTYPRVFFSPSTTKYIIEANAGYAQKNNVKVGDVLDFGRIAVNKS